MTRYFSLLRELLTQPTAFFRKMPPQEHITIPLAFALITHWAGKTISYFWGEFWSGPLPSGLLLPSRFWRWSEHWNGLDDIGSSELFHSFQNRFSHWIWGIGPVLLDPFITLFWILVTTAFIFAGARIFVSSTSGGSSQQITYDSTLRVICYSYGASVLVALPGIGGPLSSMWIFCLIILGCREVYHISNSRAILIGLFPSLLLLGILFFSVIFFVLGLFKFFTLLYPT